MGYTLPTVAQFKAQFQRDFPFAVPADGVGSDATDLSKVIDSDITSAIALAGANFNEGLFQDQAGYQVAYLYLAAHFLVTNLKASAAGVNGSFEWLQSSKHVAAVGATFAIPDRIKNSPYLSLLAKTTYGAQYLTIIAPLLVGNVVGFVRIPGAQ